MDFNLRGMKTIQVLEIGTSHSAGTLIAFAQWRSDKTSSFSTSPTKAVNPNGVVNLAVTATEFRIGLTYSSYLNVELDYITPRIKLSDKRSVRGQYNVT